MPLDVQSALLAQVKALLLGYAPVMTLVKPGNVITPDSPRFSDRVANKGAAGDFPQIALTIADDTTNDRPPMPFNDDPALVDYGVPMTVRLDLRITHDSTVSTAQTPLEAAVRGALLSKGRTLGIKNPNGIGSWVTSYVEQPVSRREERVGDTNRTIARMRIVVTARPMRKLLIATT